MTDVEKALRKARVWTLRDRGGCLGVEGDHFYGSAVRVIEADPVRRLLIAVEKKVDPRSMLNVEVEEMIRLLGGRDGCA